MMSCVLILRITVIQITSYTISHGEGSSSILTLLSSYFKWRTRMYDDLIYICRYYKINCNEFTSPSDHPYIVIRTLARIEIREVEGNYDIVLLRGWYFSRDISFLNLLNKSFNLP